jgi:hypothetical protein
MIRSNVPLPLLYRLRLRASWVARRAGARLSYGHQRGSSETERAVWARKGTVRRGTLGYSPQIWSEFVEEYERFTSALCCAAKSGPTAEVERDYAKARRWCARNYALIAHRIRPYLDAEFTGDDKRTDCVSVIVDYAGQKREIDVLESLFMPATLNDMLQGDHGDLLPRIHRISSAVYRCHASFEGR